MRRSNVALRPLPSLLEAARQVAGDEGVALNQLINVAMAKKPSALRTERALGARATRADRTRTLAVLARIDQGHPPLAGDELSGTAAGKEAWPPKAS